MKASDRLHHQTHDRPGLSRRDFMAIGGLGVTGYALSQHFEPSEVLAQANVDTLNTATACIFIKLAGAPSHMDTFDVKAGRWTPNDWDIRTRDGITLPNRIFPKLLEQSQHLAVVRSVQAYVPLHDVGQYWLDTGHDFNASLAGERPALGAVVAMEYADKARRQPSDVLPGFFTLVGTPRASNGFLSGSAAPFPIDAPPNGSFRLIPPEGVTSLTHPREQTGYEELWDMIQAIDRPKRGGNPPWGKAARDYNDFYEGAAAMATDPDIVQAFRYPEERRVPYGRTLFGDACLVARNLVALNKGVHFIHMTLGDWDHHNGIYQSLRTLAPVLDQGLAALITELDQVKLLEKTLIVVMGEFGRTPPNQYTTDTGLNGGGGRDHFQEVQFALFAGGGVRGGRIIGRTDDYGFRIVDPGWRHGDRGSPAGPNIRMEDIATTIYSALGINWTREIADTPSRRRYQYVEGGPVTVFREIRELFE